MTLLEAVGLVGGVASVAGLLYAIYYARRNRRVKLLTYDTTSSVPLATAQSPEDDYILLFSSNARTDRKSGSEAFMFSFFDLPISGENRSDVPTSLHQARFAFVWMDLVFLTSRCPLLRVPSQKRKSRM